jgi:hypothetical protein
MKKIALMSGIILLLLWFWPEGIAVVAAEEKDTILVPQCTQCHSLKRIKKRKRTQNGWKKIIQRMQKKLETQNQLTPIMNVEQIGVYLYKKWGYEVSRNNDISKRRKEKFRRQFPPKKPRTVSPGVKTVKPD